MRKVEPSAWVGWNDICLQWHISGLMHHGKLEATVHQATYPEHSIFVFSLLVLKDKIVVFGLPLRNTEPHPFPM
ncbi:hypothetical protein BJ508DRAFT_62431 [Ascobolus immersus RN42]|uniref:Uncharacterized protein n=1 Tax=Ascobolus immersus RN42 TaxID=1160509 RepID=A0A3N4ITK3_ASCIM|nr:hypothetical protein BJ508DRAFT_62431 [Ascobolus immersus RN42]